MDSQTMPLECYFGYIVQWQGINRLYCRSFSWCTNRSADKLSNTGANKPYRKGKPVPGRRRSLQWQVLYGAKREDKGNPWYD